MRRKNLLTAALCAVLMMASGVISSMAGAELLRIEKIYTVIAEETPAADENVPKPAAETSAPETPKATEAPVPETPKATEAPVPETPKATEAPVPETPKATEAPVPETPKATETPVPETPKATEAPVPETPKETEVPNVTETPEVTEKPSTETVPVQTESQNPDSEQMTEVPSAQMPSETLPPETMPGTEMIPGNQVPSTEQIPSGTEQLPSETVPGTELSTGTSETESESEKQKKKETEEESESETSLYGSNEELIAHQNIVIPPDIELEFRFTKIEKKYAVAANREGVQVYEEKTEDARAVGVLEYYGCCYILKEEDGWYYVESGNVRGFVKADQVAAGEVADRIVSVKGIEALPEARLLVARSENEAFTYTHTTVHEVMADKAYAIADGEVTIYEQRKETSEQTGVLAEGALCYILADETEEWVFVESSDARGFVKKSELITGAAAQKIVSEKGENNMECAQVLVAPEDNKSCYYTLTSVQEASQEAMTREAVVNYALQFIGNPYVWGGTSLTGGADCSGFVQSVYARFGYYLPRVAEAQAGYGMQIPVSSAEPGDLIFYARNGYVYHVSMYIGNGKVVQAANKNVGIITSGIAGDAVWATRVIKG